MAYLYNCIYYVYVGYREASIQRHSKESLLNRCFSMKVVRLYEEEKGGEGTRKEEYEKVTTTKVNNEGVAE